MRNGPSEIWWQGPRDEGGGKARRCVSCVREEDLSADGPLASPLSFAVAREAALADVGRARAEKACTD